ncbi:hypothetical protein [Chitinophaga sancti]|uniref:hypothetical protein n=1 Tax=Chitinophaga sancti TaxID=1004 RepID=UPI003F7A605E
MLLLKIYDGNQPAIIDIKQQQAPGIADEVPKIRTGKVSHFLSRLGREKERYE